MGTSEYLGPVDYLAVEFPTGELTGSGFKLIRQLVDSGTINVLDLEFVLKAADGTTSRVALDDLPAAREQFVAAWAGSFSGILGQDDLDAVASAIEPGSLAGILVYENAWAAPIMEEIATSGAVLLGTGRVDGGDLSEVLGLATQDDPTGT